MNENKMIDTIMRKAWKIILLFLACCVVTVFVNIKLTPTNRPTKGHLFWMNSSREQENNMICPKKHFESGIDKLQQNVNALSNSECSFLYKKFLSMYEIDVFNASQKLNKEFSKKMKAWIGDNDALLELAEFQTVFMVHDILLQKTTVFNPLRSKRPISKSQNSLLTYIKNISESSRINCDFCKPFNSTAEDVFGRIQGKYSVSASNAFKLGKWHGLFIPYEHSILDIDLDIFLDVFNTSLKWFKKVHSIDGNAQYPVLIWDMFPHAGASQMHVHAHGIVGEHHYPGEFGDVLNAVRTFHHTHEDHYWNTIIEIHEILGLVVKFGKTIIIAPLVPRREHELWVLNNTPSTEFFTVLFSIIKMYEEKLEKYCFSMAGALPVLGQQSSDPEQSLPSVIFIGTRGDCSSSVSDVSSLELYLFNNVNTDPYKTINILRQYLRRVSTKFEVSEEMENLWNNSSLDPE